MSQQGERPAAQEDDWWRRLYDESAPDTGASQAADSLDDRFDSASDAVGRTAYGAADAIPEPRTAPAVAPPPPLEEPPRAPWEPPAGISRPRTFAVPVPVPVPEPVRAPEPMPEPVPEPTAPEPVPAAPVPPLAVASPSPAVDPRLAQSLPSGRDAGMPPAADAVPPLPRRPVVERNGDERQEADAEAPVQAPAAPDAGARKPQEPEAHRPVSYVGARPPTYDAEPTALPATDPHEIHALVADTVLDGARYGTYTLRAASVRGDSARFRGEPRRDALVTVRFGAARNALVLVAVAGGARTAEGTHPAAADACRSIAEAVGRSHARLSEDIREGRRGELKSGLHRLADRTYGRLRARAAELGLEPHEYTAGLRCLLLSADPGCRTRVFFGVGGGGLFRLRDGSWQDLEPVVPHSGELTGEGVVGFGSATPESGPDGERLTMDLGITTGPAPYIESPVPPPAEPFRFRASVARPGDTLLLCSNGLADPLRDEPELAAELAGRWAPGPAPGLADFLADTQLRVKGYADDRTAVGVWEA
ncbi:protein phosphatase 2C domain-containing protein [Streptomyces sp. ITFR-6]|uniref:protein phosphatase 2C domain-containing protein n=1 Tax=Streptomyces sp. ITFR-6 TaxID=3075197 RepID=UPI002889E6DB|nr:protein phosphatase 2C domain-containing protein [Streptomyces sp. ITFR-6]WNI28409.1 protein phosphatase 2C domain-containing protein [Streptomyces sp. ITFR-6]